MKLTKKLVVLVAAMFATLLASSAVAKSPWQILEEEWEFEAGYADCLSEVVSVHYWVTIRFREFETPSGNIHYIEYLTWEGEWVGQSTGRVWLEKGQSPGSSQVAKGEVGQWTSRGLAEPVVGDGPKFRYNQRYKYTVNANGELKVSFEPPEVFADWIRCLGPKD